MPESFNMYIRERYEFDNQYYHKRKFRRDMTHLKIELGIKSNAELFVRCVYECARALKGKKSNKKRDKK